MISNTNPTRQNAQWLPFEEALVASYARSGVEWSVAQTLLAGRLQRSPKAVARKADSLGIVPSGSTIEGKVEASANVDASFPSIPSYGL